MEDVYSRKILYSGFIFNCDFGEKNFGISF
jgi:hypothetical protein